MFRKISNRLAGRKKVVDKDMQYSDVQRLLEGLNWTTTRINVRYASGMSDCAEFRDATPREIIPFLEEHFRPGLRYYCEAKHQVFSGEQDERHYVDLSAGRIIASVGAQTVKRGANTTATLDYILKKTE